MFDWDEANVPHLLARHGVGPDETELAIQQHKPYQRLMKEMLLASLTGGEQSSAPNAARAALIDERVGIPRADVERVFPRVPAPLLGR